jgi:phosphoserine phosphatase RsbU/P
MDIIVVEDDPIAAQLLVASIESLGHRVTSFGNGQDAWHAYNKNPTPVVASDWNLPLMDGLQLTEAIRKRKSGSYTYIVLVTANTGKENYQRAMQAGVDDFLTKPIDQNQLHIRLKVAERILGFRAEIEALKAVVPISSYCKKIRKDDQYWERLEKYMEENLEKYISHSICPDCYVSIVEPQFEELENRGKDLT